MDGEVKIPLFPLEVVLMPAMPLPLHIFEERYKLMIGECLAQMREFGVVYQRGSEMKKIGCTAQIVQILRRFDDGRLDIMTQGVRRFAIDTIYEDKTYLQAKVTYFDDDTHETTDEADMLLSDGIKLLEKLDVMTGKEKDYEPVSQLDYQTRSFVICYHNVFTLDEKQGFLEITSTNERLTKSVASLKTRVEKEIALQEVRRIVGGNGNLNRGITDRLDE